MLKLHLHPPAGRGRNRQRGFTLIESLVALVIFSIALLGMAAMYAQSVVISHGAYMRSLASMQAMDMAERIRANQFLDPAPLSTAVQTYAKGDVVGSEVETDLCSGLSSVTDCDGGSRCSPSQLRNWDHVQWCQATTGLFGGLFEGAAIRVDGNDYLIAIEWSERDPGEGVSTSGSDLSKVYFEYRMRP